MGYITGLRSFTLKDNTWFNLTTTGTYDSKFSTSSYSTYTEMSHLNFRVRNCANPYIYYCKLDGLCYNACPDGTYLISAYQLCEICQWSCATCTSAASCSSCNTNWITDTATGYCTCDLKFYLSSKQCLACHYSCETCSSDQYNQCNSCATS